MQKFKIQKISLPRDNITVVNCCDIIRGVEINIINDLHQFGLLDNIKLTTRDVKVPFYYHITSAICDHVTSSLNGDSCIYYYSACDIKFLELHEYIEAPRLKQFISTIFKHISGMLPLTFYYGVECFDVFKDSTSGDTIDIIESIKSVKYKQKKKSLEKIKKFIDTYKLKHLYENCFMEYKDVAKFYK